MCKDDEQIIWNVKLYRANKDVLEALWPLQDIIKVISGDNTTLPEGRNDMEPSAPIPGSQTFEGLIGKDWTRTPLEGVSLDGNKLGAKGYESDPEVMAAIKKRVQEKEEAKNSRGADAAVKSTQYWEWKKGTGASSGSWQERSL